MSKCCFWSFVLYEKMPVTPFFSYLFSILRDSLHCIEVQRNVQFKSARVFSFHYIIEELVRNKYNSYCMKPITLELNGNWL